MQKGEEKKKVKKEKHEEQEEAHTVNSESVRQALVIGGSDEPHVFGEQLEPQLQLLRALVALPVPVCEPCEREGALGPPDDPNHLRLHLSELARHHSDRVRVVGAPPRRGCGGAEERRESEPPSQWRRACHVLCRESGLCCDPEVVARDLLMRFFSICTGRCGEGEVTKMPCG